VKIAIALALALLAGCSDSTNGKGSDGHVSQYAYDPALCTTLRPETGGRALFENLRANKPTDSVYYAKRYNRAWLEGVLQASGDETQKFVAGMGIDLSKIPYEGDVNTCLFQHALPYASDELTDIWQQASEGVQGQGHLDGLFVAFTNNDNQDHEAIMVREDSSRWTLVHEMMHANFYRQREADGAPRS
jgi:hypothetical protein